MKRPYLQKEKIMQNARYQILQKKNRFLTHSERILYVTRAIKHHNCTRVITFSHFYYNNAFIPLVSTIAGKKVGHQRHCLDF
jgi:DeoR/GlpR family transcriptional regulator of sugar metabolism